MTFSSVINKIMPEVDSGSTEPFVIYRDKHGEWQGDFTQNQYGETFDWVMDAHDNDPFAITRTGKYFAQASAPSVYDKVLCDRIRAEYDYAAQSGQITGATYKELHALVNFFEDNVGLFHKSVTDYLTTIDKPLNALEEMCPLYLSTDDGSLAYDEDLAEKAITYIENEVNDRLRSYPVESVTEKRQIEGYTEKVNLQIAGKYVVLAENQEKDMPWLVCNIRTDNPLGFEERYDGIVTDDYIEAVREFTKRVDTLAETLETERRTSGLPAQKLTAAECIKGSRDADFENKLIIVKADILAPEYRRAEHQLVLCTGGFGSHPNARGNAVFVEELYSGAKMRYERYQVEGLADLSKLPEWAVKKLALKETVKEPSVKAKTPPKKPTLSEKLEGAKKTAREAAAGGDKPKRRKDKEVT